MSKYKYFTDKEIEGLQPDVVFKLDRAREFFGYPINITCGYRSPEHNAEIGGVPNSEHTFGRAVDIKAPQDSAMRERLMWALGLAGLKRVESAKYHFHIDTSPDKPSPCWWEGKDF